MARPSTTKPTPWTLGGMIVAVRWRALFRAHLLGVEAVLAGQVAPGVCAAPSAPALVSEWMSEIDAQAQEVHVVDALA